MGDTWIGKPGFIFKNVFCASNPLCMEVTILKVNSLLPFDINFDQISYEVLIWNNRYVIFEQIVSEATKQFFFLISFAVIFYCLMKV